MKILAAALFTIFSLNVQAAVKCDVEYIKFVQVKSNGSVVYFTQSGVLRGLGNVSDPTLPFMYQALLLSIEKNLMVQVAYKDGFNCKQENTDAKADWVMVQNINR